MKEYNITLKIKKFSTNQLYSGGHWIKRAELKNAFILLVKSQFKHVFSSDKKYIVSYAFFFKNNPLDASNCSGMIKMIEDIIFQDDKWDIIDIGYIRSRKSPNERVEINIIEL